MKISTFPILRLFIVFGIIFSFSSIHAQGILILDGSDGTYLPITKSTVQVDVLDQVGEFTCSQTFYNNLGVDTTGTFAFALPEEGAALRIDYQVDGVWYEAIFSNTPQDTLLPGEDTTLVTTDPTAMNITDFLGDTPIYFNFGLNIPAGSSATFVTQYVELLKYNFNHVSYLMPGDYSILGLAQIDTVIYTANISSQRDMFALEFSDQSFVLAYGFFAGPNSGVVTYTEFGYDTQGEVLLDYELESATLGLIDFSTYLPDSLKVCDTLGNGFVGLIIEPEGDVTQVVDKDFILIIDKSGSMGGNKLPDAQQAAHYVLDNLNPNDRFNIVAFDSYSASFAPSLLTSTLTNVTNGHNYIDGLSAGGGTNISSSFDLSIPMFSTSPAQNAKMIVFLTDGQASGGIATTPELVNHVNSLVASAGLGYEFSLNCFGVDGANQQLLDQLASQNNGMAFYINASSLITVMSNFYNTIQNPVVLNTQLNFSPPLVTDIYPAQLPNLYLGQQLVVFGRYDTTGTTQVTLSGVNNGSPVSYTYNLQLSDTLNPDYAFLPKMWAKKYIDHEMSEYYAQSNLSGPEADSIRDLIIESSLCNGVLSPFTSFQQGSGGGGGPLGIEEVEFMSTKEDLLIYPNPFEHTIAIDLTEFIGQDVVIQVYDMLGNLVFETSSHGTDQVEWNGQMPNGEKVRSGMYLVKVLAKERVITGLVEKI